MSRRRALDISLLLAGVALLVVSLAADSGGYLCAIPAGLIAGIATRLLAVPYVSDPSRSGTNSGGSVAVVDVTIIAPRDVKPDARCRRGRRHTTGH